MNEYSVLTEGFEHLSYPLGHQAAEDGAEFSCNKERFVLFSAADEIAARMALGAQEALSEHTTTPIGYLKSKSGKVFLVCRRDGRKLLVNSSDLDSGQKMAFSRLLVRRLALLHSDGLGCGGLKPDAVEISEGALKLLNPCGVYAAGEDDTLYFEAACTLRALVASGFASLDQLESLSYDYISFSPVCRHEVASYASRKGLNASLPSVLADSARRCLRYI